MAYDFFSNSALTQLITKIKAMADTKVDKVTGKVLSANDFTDELKTKLDGIEAGANKYVLPEADATTLGGVKIGAGLNIEAGVLNANGKVDKVDGKGLSTEDFTTEEKQKLATIVTGVSSVNGKDGAVVLTAEDVDAYTKAEVDAKMVKVFVYKGSVDTVAELPTDATAGDVYDVKANGHNYVYDGTTWDDLGGTFDVSGLVAKTDMVEITGDDVDTEWARIFA